jgi:hypothetical protein
MLQTAAGHCQLSVQGHVCSLALPSKGRWCGLMEHPASASWEPRHASSWMVPEMQRFIALSCSGNIEIDQCEFGLDARKRTGLYGQRLPGLQKRFTSTRRGGFCSHPGGHVGLSGVGGDGWFRTFHAETYPEQMCAAIADVLHDAIGQALGVSQLDQTDLPQELAVFHNTSYGDRPGNDYD